MKRSRKPEWIGTFTDCSSHKFFLDQYSSPHRARTDRVRGQRAATNLLARRRTALRVATLVATGRCLRCWSAPRSEDSTRCQLSSAAADGLYTERAPLLLGCIADREIRERGPS